LLLFLVACNFSYLLTMHLKDLFNTSISGLHANRPRTLLTVLGIVIGIAAIILIASLGANAERVIVGELGGLGAETIVVRPGKEPTGPSEFAETLFTDSLKERELSALLKKSNVPDLADAAPEVIVAGSVSYKGETFRPLILGFSADFMLETLGLSLSEGVPFGEREIRTKARVAIIGDRVKKELFGSEDPLGKQIQIKDTKFRVGGVFAPKGQVVFFDVDELVLVPYSTAHAYLSGIKYFNQIIVRATSKEAVSRAVFDIEETLRSLHRIDDPDKDDFYVQTQQGLVEQVSTIINMFTVFLALVVAISLVVGGVGIMNIMLVSVSERTKEIGLRKAIGATNRDIMLQFLFEAILLTTIGGLLGVVVGALLSFVASIAMSVFLGIAFSFTLSYTSAFIGIASAVIVGVVFGIYPARKASRMHPIDALRYE
jgi:putative ABC transport system permease protein